jgi:hypothetical protein
MTAKKSSLLERGVFKDNCKDKPEELMQKTNVNVDALLEFARDAAVFKMNFLLTFEIVK